MWFLMLGIYEENYFQCGDSNQIVHRSYSVVDALLLRSRLSI